MNKEWTAYINQCLRHRREPGFKVYIAFGSPMWCAYMKAKREAEKRTIRGRLRKIAQAVRVITALIIRTYRKQ